MEFFKERIRVSMQEKQIIFVSMNLNKTFLLFSVLIFRALAVNRARKICGLVYSETSALRLLTFLVLSIRASNGPPAPVQPFGNESPC